jgi:hypothetical protein
MKDNSNIKNLGQILMSSALTDVHISYKRYENEVLKEHLGTNYMDYLRLSKQIDINGKEILQEEQ